MSVRRLVRALYTRASDSPALGRVLDAARANPRVRVLARRHIGVLLARGATWANVDGVLRLLAEDPDQPVVFGPWEGDSATELLYWAPFVRWAQGHFSFDPRRIAVVSRGGVDHWYGDACGVYAESLADARRELPDAAVFRPEPVLSLVERYRGGAAAPRPLLKRSRHVALPPPSDGVVAGLEDGYVATALDPTPAFPDSEMTARAAAALLRTLERGHRVVRLEDAGDLRAQHALLAGAGGLVAAYSGIALLGALSGLPVIALRSPDGDVAEPDIDLALRVVSGLGGSLSVLDVGDLPSFRAALGDVVREGGEVQ
jgi:hypothetical protein